MLNTFRRFLKFGLPLLVLAGGYFVSQYLISTAPKAELRAKPRPTTAVEVVNIAPTDYLVRIKTQGLIQARTQTSLIAEVSGKIVQVSDKFKAGGFFEKDEIILNIDPRDYEQALTIAKAEHQQAALALADEKTKREQARRDYAKLGFKGKPNALTLREPQIKTAQARLSATRAKIAQAETRLSRTTISAPYAGRILRTQADIGQFVSVGNQLGQLYATDFVELRVPINEQQARFLNLPKNYQGEAAPAIQTKSNVEITAVQAGKTELWQGTVVRAEGIIDAQSRQQFIVIQVDAPYQRYEDERAALKIGQFVQASIQGKSLEAVFVIPREYIYGEDELQLMNKDNRLERRKVPILWRDESHLIVGSGLLASDRIIKTPLSFASDGMALELAPELKITKKANQTSKAAE